MRARLLPRRDRAVREIGLDRITWQGAGIGFQCEFAFKMGNGQIAVQADLNIIVGNYTAAPHSIKATACSDRPQQKIEVAGPGALSDTELISVLIGSGTRGNDALNIARKLMTEAGSITRLATWKPADFRRIKGIGRIKAHRLVAIAEMARRAIAYQGCDLPVLNRAELVADYFGSIVFGLDVEKFWVLSLNRKNRLIKRTEVTSGTATNSLVHPREVFREAIREGASAVICVHNHPSGDPTPSSADIQVTRQLREAAKTVCIDLLDHVIVGRPEADPSAKGHYSFRESGLL